MPITKARLKIHHYNEKRKANLKHSERRLRIVNLSLTSMVDMFAILVIFLLTCTSSVSQWIEVGHGIELPKAKFSEPPPRAATLQVANDAVYADDKPLITIPELLRGPMSVEAIRNYLLGLPKKDSVQKEGYVNILGHEKVPFGAVKRIIASCQDAGFGNVNLAVHPK